MNGNDPSHLHGEIVEERIEFTLVELCRITGASRDDFARWVEEGAFEPQGAGVEEWRFSGTCLGRAITAQRLKTDLELNAPGVALALDLLDQIDALRKRLARFGDRGETHDGS
ncbi:Chaperone modulatory protein CbpM [Caballeronia temeraria]|uniref:Chaperone modulatory protein CbpM n=1 Tax=Caballeronia temeraria TaxID=1777137 RepID=A0A158ASL7_9BURK|nr:chaperone modulator CbpM [Caballeronia temeraria]SAK60948.1 Chaperone modulatory protein CbpM [Caballeronia temeraria]